MMEAAVVKDSLTRLRAGVAKAARATSLLDVGHGLLAAGSEHGLRKGQGAAVRKYAERMERECLPTSPLTPTAVGGFLTRMVEGGTWGSNTLGMRMGQLLQGAKVLGRDTRLAEGGVMERPIAHLQVTYPAAERQTSTPMTEVVWAKLVGQEPLTRPTTWPSGACYAWALLGPAGLRHAELWDAGPGRHRGCDPGGLGLVRARINTLPTTSTQADPGAGPMSHRQAWFDCTPGH